MSIHLRLSVLLFLLSLSTFLPAQVSNNMTLLSQWDNNNLPSTSGIVYNEIWGWADSTGREYAIMGTIGMTYFIDVTDPYNPVIRDSVIAGHSSSIWRDFKTYGHYCYGVADAGSGSTLQIIDMSFLPDSVSVVYDSNAFFTRAHNIFIDVPAGRLYAAGANTQRNGIIVLDLTTNPANPTQLSSLNLGSYTHDIHVRNDTAYLSNAFNGLAVYDYSNAGSPVQLGTLSNYPQQGYNHSSWLTENGDYLVMADETHNTAVKMVDVRNMNNIGVVSLFRSKLLAPLDTGSIIHNPFVAGKYGVFGYYHDGVQLYDLSNPTSPQNVGWYDTEPGNTDYTGFTGCWGVYPYLPSGIILASDVNHGLFVLRPNFQFPYELQVSLGKEDATCTTVNDGNITPVITGGNGPYAYLWSTGDTTESLNGLNAGVYRVTITDRWGYTVTDSITIVAGQGVQGTANPIAESCSGSSDGSIGLLLGGGSSPYSYNWSNGSTSPALINIPAGTYSITVSDTNNCTWVDTVVVPLTATTPVANAGNDTLACDFNLQLNATLPNPGSGLWSVAGGTGNLSQINDPNAFVSNLSSGFPTTLVWTANNNGCLDRDTIVVELSQVANSNAGIDTAICMDQYQLFGFLPPNTTGMWSVFSGSGSVSQPSFPRSTVTGLSKGRNQLIWTVQDTNCLKIDTVNVDVDFAPVAGFNFQKNLLSVTFSDNSTDANSWFWDFGDGNTSTQQNPQHSYSLGGVYNVCLIVGNNCGGDTSCTEVNVSGVGVDPGVELAGVKVYPNPSQNGFWIGQTEVKALTLSLYDAQGKLLRMLDTAAEKTWLDLASFAKGVYLLQVRSGESHKTFRLILQP